MEENKFELSPEAQEQLTAIVEKAVETFNILYDALFEVAKSVLEKIKEIAIYFGRLFFKMQLLEWKIPLRWADLISQKIYWYWAVRIGFDWFNRKLLPA